MFEVFARYLESKIKVSDLQLSEIEVLCTPSRAERGRVLMQIGDSTELTFFVTKGCLRSYVIDKKGREHVLQFAPENWWISDWIGQRSGEPAMFYIDAVEDTEYLALPEDFFNRLSMIVPASKEMIDKLQLNSFRSFRMRLISLLSATGEERYLSFIKTYPSLALRLPQKMIASYLGITPESLSRIRKSLSIQ
jgi:CRP-like cAMP-binding protein